MYCTNEIKFKLRPQALKSLNLFHDVLNGKSIFLNIDKILFYLSSTEVDSVSYFDFLFAFYNVYAFFLSTKRSVLNFTRFRFRCVSYLVDFY